jgi:hypothetical protein
MGTSMRASPRPRHWALRLVVCASLLLAAVATARAREAGDPIRLEWTEGDVAGMTPIWSADGSKRIGFVEYHQRREGDRLKVLRVSRFTDGSSDEDQVEARVADTLEAVRGRSIIRDTQGATIVDLSIDVASGRITGFSANGKEREEYDEHVTLPLGTYWGPLIFIVVKNFDQNASGDRLVFRTVAPTPSPRVIDMELVREGAAVVSKPGGKLDVMRLALRPTVHWIIDPIIQRLVPESDFFMRPGAPPALARFDGPRNYTGQEMRLE